MEHPGAAGSGEVEACREGDVVEAEAETMLNNLNRIESMSGYEKVRSEQELLKMEE